MAGAPHPELPGAGELIADEYQVERVLGSGGVGVVLAVRHVALGHSVALELLSAQALKSPQAKERFLREARLAVMLKSEHVARAVWRSTSAGRSAIASAFCCAASAGSARPRTSWQRSARADRRSPMV